ncbi:MAG: SGNH/GDSL hydrolase family protein [Chthoniobacterales bacterium]
MSVPVKSIPLSLVADSTRGGYAGLESSKLLFHRMTPKMEGFFDRTDQERIRKVCAAGMRLVFESDTRIIRARFHFGKAARQIFTVDVIVDGIIHTVDAAPCLQGEEVTLWQAVADNHKPRHFEIWLSAYAETSMSEFSIEENASLVPSILSRPRWIAIGDSITQGMSASSPARTWVATLSRNLKLDVTNLGVGGAIMEADLADYISGESCDFLTIAFGTNDHTRPCALVDYQKAYSDFISRLSLAEGCSPRILIVGPPVRCDNPKNSIDLEVVDYQRAVKEVCDQIPGVTYVDGFSLVPAEQRYFPEGDVLHPNDLGMETFAKNIAPFFE